MHLDHIENMALAEGKIREDLRKRRGGTSKLELHSASEMHQSHFVKHLLQLPLKLGDAEDIDIPVKLPCLRNVPTKGVRSQFVHCATHRNSHLSLLDRASDLAAPLPAKSEDSYGFMSLPSGTGKLRSIQI